MILPRLGYRESLLIGVLTIFLTWHTAAFGEPVSALEVGRFGICRHLPRLWG